MYMYMLLLLCYKGNVIITHGSQLQFTIFIYIIVLQCIRIYV